MCMVFIVIFTLLLTQHVTESSDRIKLENVQTLTLYRDRMTTSRRSYPVPQIKCIGSFCDNVPQVVQCTNRGSDGYDTQWECRAEMDNAYRFGRIEVICEGYDYPDDPYILKGSCGLECTLEQTKEGERSRQRQGDGYYDDYSRKYSPPYSSGKNSFIGNLILFAMVALIIYGIYRSCLSSYQYSPTDDGLDSPPGGRWSSNTFGGSSAPPPGFRSEYMPDGPSCSGTRYNSGYGGGTGGFWTGAMTGGILGYLFGNRQSGYSSTFSQPYHSSSPPSSGWSWGGGSSGSSFEQSSGTRTTSGYGGTRRR